MIAVALSGICRPQDVIHDPECTTAATECRGGRPYVCGGGDWHPIGESVCADLGAVCCYTASHVYACVRSSTCVAVDAGVR